MRILIVLALILLAGCTSSPNELTCATDGDCVPQPGCHSHNCINSAFIGNYKQPDACTLIFDSQAAYSPEDCICVEGLCKNKNLEPKNFRECEAAGYNVTGNQCRVNEELVFTQKMSYEEALQIAQNSICTQEGALLNTHFFNENSKTWWIDLKTNPERQGCSPACVINAVTKKAEINWRCTGLIMCKDLCGNGRCEEIVCQAEGCPCAENKASCPQDCI